MKSKHQFACRPHRPYPEPWHVPIYGEQFFLLVDAITARCIAEGIVPARLQVQAHRLCQFVRIDETRDEIST